jgi:hypothetical protein
MTAGKIKYRLTHERRPPLEKAESAVTGLADERAE